MKDTYSFGKRLKFALQNRRVTQKKLAEDLNTTAATISRYINDQRSPTAEFIRSAALSLDVSADFLLGLTSRPDMIVKDVQIDSDSVKIGVQKDSKMAAGEFTESEILVIRALIDEKKKNDINTTGQKPDLPPGAIGQITRDDYEKRKKEYLANREGHQVANHEKKHKTESAG